MRLYKSRINLFYNLVNEYCAQNRLLAIPLSSSLTYVAQIHVRDLDNSPPSRQPNLQYNNTTIPVGI